MRAGFWKAGKVELLFGQFTSLIGVKGLNSAFQAQVEWRADMWLVTGAEPYATHLRDYIAACSSARLSALAEWTTASASNQGLFHCTAWSICRNEQVFILLNSGGG